MGAGRRVCSEGSGPRLKPTKRWRGSGRYGPYGIAFKDPRTRQDLRRRVHAWFTHESERRTSGPLRGLGEEVPFSLIYAAFYWLLATGFAAPTMRRTRCGDKGFGR